MRIIILAGGKGARLAPYTAVFPKPLVPVGDRPILEIIIRQLKNWEFRRITLAVGHLAELIEAYFGDGGKFGVHIDYSKEEHPLGTAGPLALIDGLVEPFIVMNSDLLTNLNYGEMADFHLRQGAIATIGMYQKDVNIDLGVIEMDGDFRLTGYIEKPRLKYQVSMGIYIFEPEVLDFIPRHQYFDFPDLVKALLGAGKKVVGYPFEGYWLDIGRHDDYAQAIEEFEKIKGAFKIS